MYPEKLPKEKHYIYTNDQFINALDLIHAFVMPDYNINMHIQDFWEINIIMNGTGMHYIESRHLPVKRGDIFIIPPLTAHGYVGEQGFDVYHFLINNKFMEKYIADLQLLPAFFILFKAEPLMRSSGSDPLHLTLTESQYNKTEPLLQELTNYSAPQRSADSIFCNSLAMMLITSLCEMYQENTIVPDNISAHHDEAFMNALSLIHERYYEKISIAQLAKTAQLSRSSFLRKFQEICKMPPARYLTQRRIEAAKHMLINTTLSASDIAAQTGFYDAAHFTKIFLAETGITPNAFRKVHSLK